MNGYIPLIYILKTNGPIINVIGGSGVGAVRVFPGDAPQGSIYPQIMVDTFDVEAFDTKDGASSLDHDLVKVSAYAQTDEEALALMKLIRAAIDEKGSGTFNGYTIENIRYLRGATYDDNVTNRRIRVHESDFEVRIKQP